MPKNPTFREIANSAAGKAAGLKAAGLKAPEPPDRAEDRLQEAMALFVEWLRHRRWLKYPDLVFFCPNEGAGKGRAGKMRAFGAHAGVPDWHIGRDLKVETKSPKGSLSPAQKKFRDQWVELGGVFVVCRSMADFAELLLHHAAHPQFESTPWRDGADFEMVVKELAEKARVSISIDTGKSVP